MTNFNIGDTLIRIKNAAMVSKKVIEIPKFKFAISVLEVLKEKGFIANYEVTGRELIVTLKYADNGLSAIQNVSVFSRPGRRWYMKVEDYKPVRSGTGIMIVSTPRGVMTTVDARKMNVGGELICEVW